MVGMKILRYQLFYYYLGIIPLRKGMKNYRVRFLFNCCIILIFVALNFDPNFLFFLFYCSLNRVLQ